MIGIDLVEVARINESLKNENFIKKILTEQEIKYVNKFKSPNEHIAGFFAVKEAVMKALKDCKKIGFTEIEIFHDEFGAPCVRLYGNALKVFNKTKAKSIEVSISQTTNFATGMAMLVF